MSRPMSNIEKGEEAGPLGATPVMVRVMPEQLDALDAFASDQRQPVSRPEAIRLILREFLGSKEYFAK